MKRKNSILILGGDERLKFTKQIFLKHDILTEIAFNSNDDNIDYSKYINKYKNILLPYPVSKDGVYINSACENKLSLKKFSEDIKCAENVFVGGNNEMLFNVLPSKGINVVDYTKLFGFLNKNAEITAEGIYNIIKNENYINKKSILITGFGYTAKAAAKLLKHNGFDITISARSPQNLKTAKETGYDAIDICNLLSSVKSKDIIINTVPANIFDDVIIENISNNSLYIDIASVPYGMAHKKFKFAEFNALIAPNLPAKTNPQRAGCIIADTVFKIIEEEKK